jgi:hypothetical protein
MGITVKLCNNVSQDHFEGKAMKTYSDVLLKRLIILKENRRYYYWTTRGQELVGLRFNPSGLNEVDKAKQLSADLMTWYFMTMMIKVTKETLLYLGIEIF